MQVELYVNDIDLMIISECVHISKHQSVSLKYIPFLFVNCSFSSVAQPCPTLLRPHEPQHSRPPCPSPTPGVYTNSCPLSR